MTIKFSKPLAYSKDYPKPIIKGGMSFKFSDLLFKKDQTISDDSFFAINGRTGLAIIAQHIQLKENDTVLLPSYHCPALVEPFIWMGVNIRFYNLNKDLSIDTEDFNNKMDSTVSACLFVHFFSFPPDLSALNLLEKYKDVTIIEDCAHSFYAPKLKKGDYSIVSCNKFFPCIEGSIVYGVKETNIESKLVSPPLLNDLKMLLNILPLIPQLMTLLKKIIPTSQKNNSPITKQLNTTENKPFSFRYFNPNEINKTCSRVSKFIVEHSNHKKLKKKRRDNFSFLLQHLSKSAVGKPLFSELPDNVIPYVFPFILNNPQSFDKMKHAGLALFRWEELADTDCTTSHLYRDHLVQIPCHQDLTQDELDEIIMIIKTLDE